MFGGFRGLLQLCIVDILTFIVLLLHRGWHQELLQEDWLPVTRPIHGEDAKILAPVVHLMQCFWQEVEIPGVLNIQQRG